MVLCNYEEEDKRCKAKATHCLYYDRDVSESDEYIGCHIYPDMPKFCRNCAIKQVTESFKNYPGQLDRANTGSNPLVIGCLKDHKAERYLRSMKKGGPCDKFLQDGYYVMNDETQYDRIAWDWHTYLTKMGPPKFVGLRGKHAESTKDERQWAELHNRTSNNYKPVPDRDKAARGFKDIENCYVLSQLNYVMETFLPNQFYAKEAYVECCGNESFRATVGDRGFRLMNAPLGLLNLNMLIRREGCEGRQTFHADAIAPNIVMICPLLFGSSGYEIHYVEHSHDFMLTGALMSRNNRVKHGPAKRFVVPESAINTCHLKRHQIFFCSSALLHAGGASSGQQLSECKHKIKPNFRVLLNRSPPDLTEKTNITETKNTTETEETTETKKITDLSIQMTFCITHDKKIAQHVGPSSPVWMKEPADGGDDSLLRKAIEERHRGCLKEYIDSNFKHWFAACIHNGKSDLVAIKKRNKEIMTEIDRKRKPIIETRQKEILSVVEETTKRVMLRIEEQNKRIMSASAVPAEQLHK